MVKISLSDQLATELEYFWAEIGRSELCCASSLEDENPEKDEIRKAYIYGRQRKAVPIGILSPWRQKLIDRRITVAEKLHKHLVNLKNSRNGSSHEANVKESSFENFLVPSRMDRGKKVSDSYHAQDEKIRRASTNPISDFQDPADASKELIDRRARKGKVVIPSSSLGATPVSEIWFDCEIPSLCESNLPTEHRVHVNTELLELDLDNHLAVKRKNSRKWLDTLRQMDKFFAHIYGRPDQKPYNMLGTTAFRSHPQWGDNGGEKHILPGDHHSHDYSVVSPNSVPLASGSSSYVSSKDGDGDKEPPPNRSPPYGLASSQAEGQHCFPSLAMISLFLGAEVCVAAPLIRYNAGTSLSEAARTLLFVAKLLGFAGFLLCVGACIVQRSRRASGLMTAMGCAATVCGFLSILGTLFPENIMLWLIGALCVLPISAIPFAFKRSV